MELATRPLLGWFKHTITLDIGKDENTVTIEAPGGTSAYRTTSRMIAKEWYFHPFAYGLELPNPPKGEVTDGIPDSGSDPDSDRDSHSFV